MNTHNKIELPEPDSYLFQHEETGLTQYVDRQQVEWGFEKNNPRWQKISGAFTEKQVIAAIEADRQRRMPPSEPFAIVIDRIYDGEGPSLAYWNGENYQFSDGDCFNREGDTLDGYKAEFLTDYQIERRIFSDRQRRGEPVAWRWRWKTDGSPLERRFADPDLYQWAYRDDRPTGESAKLMIIEALYDAPQPAEPVKVPSEGVKK